MNEYKENIRRVFWLYFVLFVALQLYLIIYIFINSKNIITNPNNPRLSMRDSNIKRGTIYDSGLNVLAQSENIDGIYTRNYAKGRAFVHVLGNVKYQKSGVEAKYNFKLQQLQLDLFQRIRQILTDNELVANDVVLTINADFQQYVYEKLGNNKGAIVCMEPSTGKILAMVSYPNYDPNTITEDWETLSVDEENSPLLNRASKGLYPPGSVFKIITSTEIMRKIPDYETYMYTCKGEETFSDQTIQCFDKTAHGDVDLKKAFTVSCNTYFAHMSIKLDNDAFKNFTEQLYFNKNYSYPLEYTKSSFVLNNNSSEQETIQTSIGQGKTLMTPLHITMITSAVANGGIMMEPYITDYIRTSMGYQKDKTIPKMIANIMTSDEASKLTDLMWNVVTTGTGRRASIKGVEMSAKTGTAQNSTGIDHGLFAAFAPSEKPDIAVTIVLEQSGGSSKCLPMARDIISYYLDNFAD